MDTSLFSSKRIMDNKILGLNIPPYRSPDIIYHKNMHLETGNVQRYEN